MGIKLHDVSPAAAMFTGKGGMGKLMSKGYVGLLPAAIAKKAQKDTEERERMQAEAASYSSLPTGRKDGTPAPVQMKKGGKVSSASSRADGRAVKGKTKGRMV